MVGRAVGVGVVVRRVGVAGGATHGWDIAVDERRSSGGWKEKGRGGGVKASALKHRRQRLFERTEQTNVRVVITLATRIVRTAIVIVTLFKAREDHFSRADRGGGPEQAQSSRLGRKKYRERNGLTCELVPEDVTL